MEQEKDFGGYTSQEGKKKAIRTTVIMAVLAVIIQTVPPMVVVFMTVSSLFSLGENTISYVERGALWNGALWSIDTKRNLDYGPFADAQLSPDFKGEISLVRYLLDSKFKSSNAELPKISDAWLVSTKEHLWVVAPELVGSFSQEGQNYQRLPNRLDNFSPPFLYNDRLGVISIDEGSFFLFLFENGNWVKNPELEIRFGDDYEVSLDNLRVVRSATGHTLFCQYNETIYERPLETAFVGGEGEWETVWQPENSNMVWDVATVGNRFLLFAMHHGELVQRIYGLEKTANGWEPYLELECGSVSGIRIFPQEEEKYLLAYRSALSQSTVLTMNGKQRLEENTIGDDPMDENTKATIANHIIDGISWMFPVFMVLILSPMLLRNRYSQYKTSNGNAVFSSLARRGFAKGLDTLIVFGPMLASIVGLSFWGSSIHREGLSSFATQGVFLGLSFVWMTLLFFVLSYMEGKFGTSPARLLFGIRVLGKDLAPCGVGRALLRNLVTAGDCLFYFVVGIIFIVITKNQQRLGDLAAKTVVVRVSND